ncbi:MAG TPA: hypothetical protein VM925_06040 [Labilithrix sp.]|nr:hypothetical protein [Labilithrix sp.]
MLRRLSALTHVALIALTVPACGALFGVDFEDVRTPTTVGPDAGSNDGSADGEPVEPVDPPETLGPDGSCADGRKRCDDLCVSKRDPAYGCEAEACTPCSIASGIAVCVGGACAVGSCKPKRADCNASVSDGCETNTATSHDHCGGCGNACADDRVCASGTCATSCGHGETACR